VCPRRALVIGFVGATMLLTLARFPVRRVRALATPRNFHATSRALIIRPVGEYAADTGHPGPDPAGVRALEKFVAGAPANFITDMTYRVAAFTRADTDKSKSIDLAELQAILEELHPAGAADAAALLASADKNGDGVLQLAEFMDLFAKVRK